MSRQDPDRRDPPSVTDLGDRGRGKEGPGPRAGESWGRYRIEALLGEGGMGWVYLAHDPRLDRRVALKLLRVVDDRTTARFLAEARAQAAVEHSSVCPIHEAGEHDGQPFIAMRFVGGPALDECAPDLTLQERVGLLAEVARAVHEAHRRGLIHRDLKPSNILVERSAHGGLEPWVVDFGLAREMGSPGLTADGVAIGTPHYMAPEQIVGAGEELDRRTDVYGLGATLFAVLTQRPPFDAGTSPEVLLRVLDSDPPTLTQVDSRLPKDLESITAKCLEKSPDRRYDSARELAEDLERFLDGEPVLARRAGWWYRTRRWARRHRVLVTIGLAALLGILVAAGVAVRTWHRSAVRAEAAERFGRTVTELEYLLRVAHTLPLHDIREARNEVSDRLLRIRSDLDELGSSASGPGHYALGRGALLLGDPETARRELEAAWQTGYRPQRVAADLGLAIGQLYARELAATERLAAEPLRRERREELQRELRDVAIGYLDQAGTASETPSYTRGWLAYLEGDLEQAARLAGRALEESPWLYESWVLRGDIEIAHAEEARQVGDYESALDRYRAADEAFAEATRIGESDPVGYVGRCHVAARRARVRRYWVGGDTLGEARTGIDHCRHALVADRDHAPAHRWLAEAHLFAGDHLVIHGEDPRSDFDQAAAAAARAHELDPENPEPYIPWVRSYWRRAAWEMESGEGAEASFQRGHELATAAIAVDPTNDEFHTSLALLLMDWGIWLTSNGVDPRPHYDEGTRAIRRAIDLNPTESRLHMDEGILHLLRGIYRFQHDEDPTEPLDLALVALDRALKLNPQDAFSLRNRAEVRRYQAADAWRRDRATTDRRFTQAVEDLDRSDELHPGSPHSAYERAQLELERARWIASSTASPDRPLSTAVETARRAAEAYRALNPDSAEGWVFLGEALRLSPGWSLDPTLQRRTLDSFRRATDANPRFDQGWVGLAEALRSRYQSSGRPDDLREAARSIERGLEIRPDRASSWREAATIYELLAQRGGTDRSRHLERAESARALSVAPPLRPSPLTAPSRDPDVPTSP